MKHAFLIILVLIVSLEQSATFPRRSRSSKPSRMAARRNSKPTVRLSRRERGGFWLVSMPMGTSSPENASTRFTMQPRGSSGRWLP